MPQLSSSSSTAGGAVRTWKTVGEFTQEVAVARIYDGVHYRNSTEMGCRQGLEDGALRREFMSALQSFPGLVRLSAIGRLPRSTIECKCFNNLCRIK